MTTCTFMGRRRKDISDGDAHTYDGVSPCKPDNHRAAGEASAERSADLRPQHKKKGHFPELQSLIVGTEI